MYLFIVKINKPSQSLLASKRKPLLHLQVYEPSLLMQWESAGQW